MSRLPWVESSVAVLLLGVLSAPGSAHAQAKGDLGLSCALEPIVQSAKDAPTSCEGKYRVVFDHDFGPDAVVSARIRGLNPDGTPVALETNALPVDIGDEVHLASRTASGSFTVAQHGRFTQVYAPVPLLEVTAYTGDRIRHAYCSPIPYLDVEKPDGEVVSASEGDIAELEVAIPRVDPATLSVLIDGVDVLAGLDIDPATDFPGGPFGGEVLINGTTVTISDLLVDSAAPDQLGANTLTAVVRNLGGGGHIVVVNGEPCNGDRCPNAVPDPRSARCHPDNVADAGVVNVFQVSIEEPAEGALVPLGTNEVLATARHGRPMTYAAVNGVSSPVDAQTCDTTEIELEGETFSVDTCELPIEAQVDQTEFSDALLELGTFDLGENIVTVSARDDLQTQTYDSHRFELGPTPPAALAQARTLGARASATTWVAVLYAFTFGVSPAGLQTFYEAACDEASETVEQAVADALWNASYPTDTLSFDRGPFGVDVPLNMQTVAVSFEGETTCQVYPGDGVLEVQVFLPTISTTVSVKGSDTMKDPVTGGCLLRVSVDTTASTTVSDSSVSYDVTESMVQYGGEATSTYDGGTTSEPVIGDDPVDVDCLGGVVFDAFEWMSGSLYSMQDELEQKLDNALTDAGSDVQEAIRASSADPIGVQAISIGSGAFDSYGMLSTFGLTYVDITDAGLTGALGMSIQVPQPDPEVDAEGVPRVVSTPADLPVLPVTGNRDMYFAASDEAFGLIFSALGAKGDARTSCERGTPRVYVDDLLPDDCSALDDPIARGRCQGARGADCDALPGDEIEACHLTQDDMASRSISADTELLFCARAPLNARMLFMDKPNTSKIESPIHVNNLEVSAVLDIDGDGALAGKLSETPACFGLLPGNTAQDCRWARSCFDVTVDATLSTSLGAGFSPVIQRQVHGIQDQIGFQCGGGLYFGDDTNLLAEAGASDPVGLIGDNLGTILPLFPTTGLSLAGLVDLSFYGVTPLAIDTGVSTNDDCPTCQEFAGTTGRLWRSNP